MKIYILLFLISFAHVAFCQSNRDNLRQPYGWEVKGNEFSLSVDQRRQSINALSSRIQAFQQKLKAMEPRINAALGGTGQQTVIPPPSDELQRTVPVVAPLPVKSSHSSMTPVSSDDQRNVQGLRDQPYRGNVGVYVLPFVALHAASSFDWHPSGGQIDALAIKQKLGFSSGWRIGKRWKNLFIDADFSYYRNKFKSMEFMNTDDFSGSSDGFGGMLNFGGNFNPGPLVSILFGAGVGAFNQEVEFKLFGVAIDEADTLFAYQVFTGINLYPTERTLVSMKYRWLNIAEMEMFSARSLHMLELAFGYVF